MCLPKAAFSSFGCSLHFSVDSAPVSDTLVLSSRIGNMLVLSYSCIVGNMLVPELSGCYLEHACSKSCSRIGNMLVLKLPRDGYR